PGRRGLGLVHARQAPPPGAARPALRRLASTKRALLSACWTRGWPRIGYEHLRSLGGLARRHRRAHPVTDEARQHRLTPWARVDGTGVPYPALA
ncbi:MAG TPA: hypothetical protein VLA62_12900, partial [Solirubrobacterales bacterium]|nr:hypothetical protein [Solirubrobacterales bacterium]